ncbi:hypothetical protein RVS70_05640 [Virgibacillus sp. M23]|uniref:hypothetical protein n=1 Tax=Virgibacillus sp. M23 TaxID=3079030 RepID=UPI002A9129F3|nr:hypothetical protein [Virgibacillus sp. M23]MDY7043683.1 hypothetical protein [Virgibacillus sp. M23]
MDRVQSYNTNQNKNRFDKPKRRKRVNVDRNTEVVIINNTFGRFIYKNPRMNMVLDMENHGDEEYITVGDLRTMLNSDRKILEGFDILITEVLDGQYELEDVLTYLGLNRKYDNYFSLSPKWKKGQVNRDDIIQFIEKSNPRKFEQLMNSMDSKLRGKVIDTAIKLFKLRKFTDYTKMEVIEKYVGEDTFDDAKDTLIDLEI